MGVKGLKSGKGAGCGKLGVRVGKGGVVKRRLEEKDVRWVMNGMVGVVRKNGEEEFITGLVEGENGWSNQEVEVVKEGVGEVDMIGEEEDVGVLSIEDMMRKSDEFLGLVEKEREVVSEKGKGVEGLGESVHAGEMRGLREIERMFENGNVWEEEGMKKRALVGEKLFEMEEDDEVVDSMEAWKLKQVVKEKRLKEERKKREKEGMVARGKELGRSREEVKKLRSEFRDWREEVEEVCYILGEKEERVRAFGLDMEIRRWGKEIRELVSKVGLKNLGEEVEKVVVRSEVVVPELVERMEKLKEKVVVEKGRSYGEVLRGVSPGMRNEEVEEVREKKGEEKKVVEESLMEREERLGRRVEVILDSQGDESMEESGVSSWSSEKVEGILGLVKGDIKKVEKRKGRLVVEMKEEKLANVVGNMEKEKWEEAVGGVVEEVKMMDTWAGLVIPAISVDRWMGKMNELKEELEGNAGIKLMKEPVWLAKEEKIREWRLREVGVLIHVARESERVKWLSEGLVWRGALVKLNRYVSKNEVEWCTKCAEFGHSWWKCGLKGKRCSVCGGKGHTGWEHRCGRCQVWRAPCVHARKCAGCGKEHTMKEANELNCVAWRMEFNRLKSLY